MANAFTSLKGRIVGKICKKNIEFAASTNVCTPLLKKQILLNICICLKISGYLFSLQHLIKKIFTVLFLHAYGCIIGCNIYIYIYIYVYVYVYIYMGGAVPWWLSSRESISKQEMWVRPRSLSQKDPLEKEMATHSSILAWEIPWTEEPGGLQSMGYQKSQT